MNPSLRDAPCCHRLKPGFQLNAWDQIDNKPHSLRFKVCSKLTVGLCYTSEGVESLSWCGSRFSDVPAQPQVAVSVIVRVSLPLHSSLRFIGIFYREVKRQLRLEAFAQNPVMSEEASFLESSPCPQLPADEWWAPLSEVPCLSLSLSLSLSISFFLSFCLPFALCPSFSFTPNRASRHFSSFVCFIVFHSLFYHSFTIYLACSLTFLPLSLTTFLIFFSFFPLSLSCFYFCFEI